MYLTYWKFREKPFENAVDPKFVYYSSHHKEALMRLYYTIKERKGIAVLTGELGSGKTLLSQILFNRIIDEGHYRVASINNPSLNLFEFIEEVIFQVEGEHLSFDRKNQILHKFQEILDELHKQHLHMVIIVDEAQLIRDEEVFEQLRLFYNYQKDQGFMLTVILAGQPELKAKISARQAFAQRINLSYHLPALSEEETAKYITHRCEVAGRPDHPFEKESISTIYKYSKGIPRKINLICDLALLQAFHEKRDSVGASTIEEIVNSIEYV